MTNSVYLSLILPTPVLFVRAVDEDGRRRDRQEREDDHGDEC